MADMSAIFFVLLILGTAVPATFVGWWLLFPNLVRRAQTRLEATPWKTFWLGVAVFIALLIPIFILLALPFGPAKFLGWMLIGGALALSSIGCAGLAALIGARLQSHGSFSALGSFVRGAVILELAAFLPIIGWLFVWIPSLLLALGATTFALLNWNPKEKPVQVTEPVPAQA